MSFDIEIDGVFSLEREYVSGSNGEDFALFIREIWLSSEKMFGELLHFCLRYAEEMVDFINLMNELII